MLNFANIERGTTAQLRDPDSGELLMEFVYDECGNIIEQRLISPRCSKCPLCGGIKIQGEEHECRSIEKAVKAGAHFPWVKN